MSIWVTGYTEAKVDGKWHCIDFFQYDEKGELHHIPCITGQSYVRQALEWDYKMEPIGVPEGLSDPVRKKCTSRDGVLYGTESPRWTSWYIVEGRWFKTADLEMPEFCGFFPRQAVSNYLANPDENSLNEETMLTTEEYQALEPEVKKAYQYFEYTDPSGSRQILRRFKRAVMSRLEAFNESLFWSEGNHEASLDDVRVLLLIG